MIYTPDNTVPSNLAMRQAIADQQHSPHADAGVEDTCMCAGDCYRKGAYIAAEWFEFVGASFTPQEE